VNPHVKALHTQEGRTCRPTTRKPFQQRLFKAHVYVEPGVQIDFVKDFRDKYDASQSESEANNKKQLFWTRASAVLIFIYAALTFWQGCSTHRLVTISQDTFNAANRPYVGLNALRADYFWKDDKNIIQHSAIWTKEATWLQYEVEIKNFGPVPGTNFVNHSKMFLDRLEQPLIPTSERPTKSSRPKKSTTLGRSKVKTIQM
jgi:hypothetical protein